MLRTLKGTIITKIDLGMVSGKVMRVGLFIWTVWVEVRGGLVGSRDWNAGINGERLVRL